MASFLSAPPPLLSLFLRSKERVNRLRHRTEKCKSTFSALPGNFLPNVGKTFTSACEERTRRMNAFVR